VRGVITGYMLEVQPAMPFYPVAVFIVLGICQIGDRIVAVRTVLSRVRFLQHFRSTATTLQYPGVQ
jgi:hypothetical protein